jgi:hypothetical protein
MIDLGSIFGGNNPFGYVTAPTGCYADIIIVYARNLILVLLVGLLVVAVVMVVVSAIRMITAGGIADAFQEGIGGIKNILVGIAFTFFFLIALYFLTLLIWPTAGAAVPC